MCTAGMSPRLSCTREGAVIVPDRWMAVEPDRSIKKKKTPCGNWKCFGVLVLNYYILWTGAKADIVHIQTDSEQSSTT